MLAVRATAGTIAGAADGFANENRCEIMGLVRPWH